MAFSGVKTRAWDRNTPDDGILFNVEYDNVYSDLNDLNDRSLPGYDNTGAPSDFDIILFDTGVSKYKRTDLRNVPTISSRDLLRQSIFNPNGLINQRRKISPDFVDDTYYNDFWTLLTENASITNGIMQYSSSDDALQISVIENVLTTRFGIIQFLESELSIQYDGEKASISFLVKANNANIMNIRAGIVAWDSTADILTSDVVSVWADTPTLVANWTFENIPANSPVTTGFTKITIENITIDTAIMSNLALFIWVPDQVNDTVLSIKECQMNIGSKVLKFGKRSKAVEEFAAKRWYRKSYKEDEGFGTAATSQPIALGTKDGSNGAAAINYVQFERMRGDPVYRFYGLGGTQSRVSDALTTAVGNERIVNGGAVGLGDDSGFINDFSLAGALAPDRFFHYDADASL